MDIRGKKVAGCGSRKWRFESSGRAVAAGKWQQASSGREVVAGMVAGYWRQGIAYWEMAAGNRRQVEAARKWQQGSATGKWWTKRKVDEESGLDGSDGKKSLQGS